MNIGQFVSTRRAHLTHVPRATWLLRQLIALRLDIPEATVWAHPDRPLPEPVLTRLEADSAALAKGRPPAYVFGRTPFLDWTFLSDERALAPRPETEALAERIIERVRPRFEAWTADHSPRVLDLCTGSGVLGLSLALAFPGAEVVVTDLCADALALAAENVALHSLGDRVTCRQGDLWQAVEKDARFDLIVANPPYVAADDPVETSVTGHEPHLALYSGDGGRAHIQTILQDLSHHVHQGALAAFELGHQHRQTLTPQLPPRLGMIAWEADPFGVERYLFCEPSPLGKESLHG